MSSVPQVNARITTVRAPASVADFGEEGAAGVLKWEGLDGVYLTERIERTQAGDASTIVVTRALIASADLPVAEGDSVTFIPDGGDEQTVPVRAVAPRVIPGLPSTVRIQLNDA